MRKTLLIAAALCLSASAMAQTFEKPLSVSQGNNLYSAPQAGDVYWKFTADQDYIATVGNYDGGEHPSVALLKDGPSQQTSVAHSHPIMTAKSMPLKRVRPTTSF